MNTSNRFKVIWWVILVFFSGCALLLRYQSFTSEDPKNLDLILFVILIGICLAPLFKEVSLLGFKYKQDLNEFKKDISNQLLVNKLEIQSLMNISNANNNNILVTNQLEPRSDEEVKKLKEHLDSLVLKESATNSDVLTSNVSDEITELFKIKFLFEELLSKHIWFADAKNGQKYSNAISKVRYLQQSDIVSQDILSGVKEVLSICNYATHGEDVSLTQLDFVKESASNLYDALKNELERSF